MDPNVSFNAQHTRLTGVVNSAGFWSKAASNLQAANYDPNAISDSGTCTYLYEDPETGSKQEGTLGDFVTTTVASLFGNKGDKSGPNWEGTGYAYSGDIVSQRDIDRLVSTSFTSCLQRHV